MNAASLFGPDVAFTPAMKASRIRSLDLENMKAATGRTGRRVNEPSARSIRRQLERMARKAAKQGGQQ
jgi:hypothetical protein